MNQSWNLNEFVEISQKKSPSFVIVAFNSAEVWSNTNVLLDRYSSHFKPLKGANTFHHTEIANYKIHGNLPSSGCPCHSSSANENKDKLKFIKPGCGKFYWVRYEFQCDMGGIKLTFYQQCVKKNDLEEHLHFWGMSQMINIYTYGKFMWQNMDKWE